MVKLFCLIVGVKGSAFCVNINEIDSVYDLKVAIKTIPSTIKCDANKLQLFLAKNDRAWLQSSSEDVKKLKKGEKTAAIQLLTQEDKELQRRNMIAAVLAGMDDPLADQIHVLVVIPELDQNEEAFWSKDIQIQADGITSKAAFDAFITPYFSEILRSCGMVFVNACSESYPWLSPSEDTDLKPVGFATHPGMYRAKPVPDDGVQRPSGFRFGVPEEELYCLIWFNSKLILTDSVIDQALQNLENLGPGNAVLFDRRSVGLISIHKSVANIQNALWVGKGTKSWFWDFITDNISHG